MASVAMMYQGSQPVCPQTRPLDLLGVCHGHSLLCGRLVFQKFPPRQLDLPSGSQLRVTEAELARKQARPSRISVFRGPLGGSGLSSRQPRLGPCGLVKKPKR